jgi:hypothetical protein
VSGLAQVDKTSAPPSLLPMCRCNTSPQTAHSYDDDEVDDDVDDASQMPHQNDAETSEDHKYPDTIGGG